MNRLGVCRWCFSDGGRNGNCGDLRCLCRHLPFSKGLKGLRESHLLAAAWRNQIVRLELRQFFACQLPAHASINQFVFSHLQLCSEFVINKAELVKLLCFGGKQTT